ncbi:nitrogenase iron-molybdenum cofactor biosynthesis protein NifN [Vibrio hangzhouensis]|uniref:Nitrogenase iron-molybdenum cofactor biosynthesis protein NifN n=1 Tax=Vibrio hangzhouensis TaxID=462991 RepID=A0A1H5TH65_9VIBR|nr:nitrogenase iron-molybdenum cofactor biosynthesis protein NifN [Vibrio hangzhouensis]SEF62103.1 nitrogenase molybdenum-iron protein NifN [Vibrio hangzhouensis]
MTKLTKNNTPLATQPLKTSPATGAALASLGFYSSLPLMHGSQGCSAFAKVYLIQHLREPIPLQNTAIDQIAAVMGSDDNLRDALVLLCEKHSPELICVMTSGLTEMQGTDVVRVIADFARQHPEYSQTRVVKMSTPDFVGTMQTGFAHAVDSIVRQLVREPSVIKRQKALVNVLCSVAMTAADIETLKRYLEAFDLEAIFAPDLSMSLDGHLDKVDFSPFSAGGTAVAEVEIMSEAVATICVGESMLPTARWLEKRFAVPFHYTDLAMGMEAADELVQFLTQLSGRNVPHWITRARSRLQDAMLDAHFILTGANVVLGLEPDLAVGYTKLLNSIGANVTRVVTTIETEAVKHLSAEEIIIGDLSMLLPCRGPVSAVISNTHAAHICEPDIPVLRAGFPCHDRFGNMDVEQFGYEGSRNRLFALSNCLLANHQDEVLPHVSQYRFDASDVVPKGDK